MKKLCIAFLVAFIAVCSVASALPVTIDKVVVDGARVYADQTNRLNIERGQEFDVRVELSAQADLEDVEVEAFISGYEYNDKEDISDRTHVFDMENNTKYVRVLELELPERMDEDDYKIRILVTDRNDDELIEDYNIDISSERHSIRIKDVIVSPAVEAGSFISANVRVKNLGAKDEESVKVRFSIPDLGVGNAVYIDELEAGDSETSEDIYLQIPKCAEPRNYRAVVEVIYDEGFETASTEDIVSVTEGDLCVVAVEDEVVVVEQEPEPQPAVDTVEDSTNMARSILEISLVALIVILAIIGIIVGFRKIGKDEEAY